jgi:hypothetical protein
VIRQRRLLDANPDLNTASEFCSPKAIDVATRIAERVFGRLDDFFGDNPRSPFRKRARRQPCITVPDNAPYLASGRACLPELLLALKVRQAR